MKRILCSAILIATAWAATICQAQEATALKLVREMLEQIAKKGGRESLQEIARLGGEKAVKEVVEKAYAEGGETLARRLARQVELYGPAVLQGARSSPARFLEAFGRVPASARTAALNAIQREPELMATLVRHHGADALLAAARHPGVAPRILSSLGNDSIGLLSKLSLDEAIQLGRLTPAIAKVTPARRQETLVLIGRAPGKIMDLLEQHPRVLLGGTILAGFLASKEQILGTSEVTIGPDGKPVVVSKPGLLDRGMKEYKRELGSVLGIIALGIAGWFGVQVWRSFILAKIKVRSAEKRAAKE